MPLIMKTFEFKEVILELINPDFNRFQYYNDKLIDILIKVEISPNGQNGN